MSHDPTAALLRDLDDPSRFELVRGVVVFRAHERTVPARKNPDGTVSPERDVKVSDADLHNIARQLNEQIRNSGQFLPITVGHPATTEQPR